MDENRKVEEWRDIIRNEKVLHFDYLSSFSVNFLLGNQLVLRFGL